MYSRDFPDQQPCSGSRVIQKGACRSQRPGLKHERVVPQALEVPLVKTKPARGRSEALLKLSEDPLVQVGWWMRCIYCLKILRSERQ